MTDLRIWQNREFFNVAPKIALDIFRDIASTIYDAEVIEYKDNKPIKSEEKKDGHPSDKHEKTPKCSRFKFSMVSIKIGETVTFTPTEVEVKVAKDDSVEYEGRIYKLSSFTGTFMPEDRQNKSGAYQRWKFFSYKGKVLEDMRMESEKGENE